MHGKGRVSIWIACFLFVVHTQIGLAEAVFEEVK